MTGLNRFRLPRVAPMLLALALPVASCGPGEDEKPGGVTRSEAEALDAAAEMLDKRELPDLPEATASAQEAPSPAAS